MMRDSARCAEELLFCMYRKKNKKKEKKKPKTKSSSSSQFILLNKFGQNTRICYDTIRTSEADIPPCTIPIHETKKKD